MEIIFEPNKNYKKDRWGGGGGREITERRNLKEVFEFFQLIIDFLAGKIPELNGSCVINGSKYKFRW